MDSAIATEEQNGAHNTTVTTVQIVHVAVGSSNPSKVQAVERAFRRAISRAVVPVDIEIQGFDVESDVPNQPFGDDETRTGAKNRAKAAYRAYLVANDRSPHIAVGMEGGLEWSDVDADAKTNLYCIAWMALYGRRVAVTIEAFASSDTESYTGDKKPIFGLAKAATFPIPDSITALIKEGVELGDADDQVFQRVKSKHKSGTVGVLTDGLIDRSSYYEHAILLALTPWIRPNLYPEGN